MGTAAQRFGEWTSASHTLSTITHLIAVVLRGIDGLFAFIFYSTHACSTSSCLHAEIVVDYRYVLAVKASPPDVAMARLVVLRYGVESASVPGCVCDEAHTLDRLFSLT